MNKNNRKNLFEKLKKEAEHKSLLKKVAEEVDVNSAMDADAYSEAVFNKLLESIKIEGIDD